MSVQGQIEWLRQTRAVSVDHDEVGPHATPGVAVPDHPWRVWVSNGEADPREWAGTMVARCHSQEDAGLVAYALAHLRDHPSAPGVTPEVGRGDRDG